MGLTQENRSLVKVIHGSNDGEFDLASSTVKLSRRPTSLPRMIAWSL